MPFSFEDGSSLPPVPHMFQQGRAFVGFGGGHPSFGLPGSALRLGSLDDSYLDEVQQGGYAVVEEDTGEEGAEEEQEEEGERTRTGPSIALFRLQFVCVDVCWMCR